MQHQLVITRDHELLKNHLVNGEPVLPGLAYLDLMYQYLDGLGHAFSEWQLRDISIYRPVRILDQEHIELCFAALEQPDGSIEIRIAGSDSAPYATALASRIGAVEYADNLDWDEMARSRLRIASAQVYEFQESLGLSHGDFMRVHGTIYADADNVYVDAELGHDARGLSQDVLFHPALLDGCVICAASGAATVRPIADGLDSQLRLPVYIESFHASEPLRVACTARLRLESMHTKGGAFYSSVDFFNQRGEKVAELHNVATTAGLSAPADDRAAASLDSDNSTTRQVEAFLLTQMADSSGGLPDGFDASANFAASGLDSASLLGILQGIERRIGQPVSPIALFENPTVRELSGFLIDRYGAAELSARLRVAQPITAET